MHCSLQCAAHTFFCDETKPKEQTVTIKNAFSATELPHKNFYKDSCVLMITGQADFQGTQGIYHLG